MIFRDIPATLIPWSPVRSRPRPQKQIVMSMETIAYIIIAAIVLAMGWIVWAVIKEGRPELPNKEDENKTR